MKRILAMLAALAVPAAAWADEAPPFAADPISLDRMSPSVVTYGNTPGDIYGEIPPGGIIAQGWDVFGPGPVLHVADLTYGLLSPQDNNDAHSNGEADPNAQLVVYFSGDDGSMGMANTDYMHQALRLQAAGDRFVTNGFTVASPAAVMAGGVATTINGPFLPGGAGNFPTNLLSANQTRYNLIPSIAPPLNNTYVPAPGETAMDDMDALELTPFDLDADNVHDTAIYFSLDGGSPSAPGLADVLVSPAGSAAWNVFAAGATLGLTSAQDDLDALAVWDSDLVLTPGSDYALFSLTARSPFLNGPDTLPNTPDDYSPADIFVTDFSGANTLFLSASSLGLRVGDNVDALDVEVWSGNTAAIETFDQIPEPCSALVLMAAGAWALVRRRRRP